MQDRLHARIDHYFERALLLTRQQSLDRKAVHDLRVFGKKLRGLLRLYRPQRVPGLASLERSIARIGKSLSGSRDNEVLIQLISSWRLQRQLSLQAIQQALVARLTDESEQRQPVNPTALHLALRDALQQWKALAPQTQTQPLKAALKQSIKKTQKNGQKVLKKGRSKRLHAWRKQVKYQYYQLDVLPPAPARSKRYHLLKTLGVLLGDIHDLDLLVRYLKRSGLETAPLIERVQSQRARLLLRVSPLFEKSRLSHEQRQQLLHDLESAAS